MKDFKIVDCTQYREFIVVYIQYIDNNTLIEKQGFFLRDNSINMVDKVDDESCKNLIINYCKTLLNEKLFNNTAKNINLKFNNKQTAEYCVKHFREFYFLKLKENISGGG